ncbi:MAG TPA: 3-phosphoshikimate 1-carboxyvinyltransferase [Nitrososphaeraceae archaeon]|nr:3-phosphoshikimate 1-carboxyvinyltransferase [Nitrososphaeraceae archaeon]
MVSVIVKKSKIRGCIRCPSSKSYTHRAIAIASISEANNQDGSDVNRSIIKNALLSRDTLATLSACKALGAQITHDNLDIWIRGSRKFAAPEDIINVENSGTTLRLITVLSSLVKDGYTVLTGDESLRKRPMQPLLNALEQLGVECYSSKLNGTAPIIIKGGGIRGGTATIDGSLSSQFISALLISGVYADSDVNIKVKGHQVSKPYIESTLSAMKAFGVEIEHSPNLLEYHIAKNNEYIPSIFDVPSDLSTAALIICACVLSGERLIIRGLNFILPQADYRIIDIVRKMGGQIIIDESKGEAAIYGSKDLIGGEFDLSDTPDLLPVVSILALKAAGQVKISGLSHVRLKETDRVEKIAFELRKLGAHIMESNDELLISAPKVLKNAVLEAYNDHRLFMAFTIASLLTDNSVVAGAESVDVSYPNFIQDMKNIGANIEAMPDRE